MKIIIKKRKIKVGERKGRFLKRVSKLVECTVLWPKEAGLKAKSLTPGSGPPSSHG